MLIKKWLVIFIFIISFYVSGYAANINDPARSLIPGEKLLFFNRYPSIIKFSKGEDNKPLVIFIPGLSQSGRISYGLPGSNPKDFLSYWVNKYGYSFLAVTYPIENPIFQHTYPAYTINDWSQSIANAAKTVMIENHLSNHVIILAWSMAGETVAVIKKSAAQNNIKVDLFISLSADEPIYNFIPTDDSDSLLKFDAAGLANIQPFFSEFLHLLDYQNKLNSHVIISPQVYLSQFIGNIPVNLLGSDLRYKNHGFVKDLNQAVVDANALSLNDYPPIAILHGNYAQDMSSFLSQSDWSSILLHQYYQRLQTCINNDAQLAKHLSFIQSIPRTMSAEVAGSHFFFVGEKGAKETADKINNLFYNHLKIEREVTDICNLSTKK